MLMGFQREEMLGGNLWLIIDEMEFLKRLFTAQLLGVMAMR
jgi:hypothetical protein